MMQPKNDVGSKTDLAKYRLQTAKDALKSAKILFAAEEIRHASDYDDFYIASREETERQIAVADEFIRSVEQYVQQKITMN